MRILIAQIYGLGNAILTTPLIQALSSMGDPGSPTHEVHVVVDPRRRAAIEVFKGCPGVKKIWKMGEVEAIRKSHIDVMVMCCDYRQLIDRYRIPRVEWGYIQRRGGLNRAEWFQAWPMHELEMSYRIAERFGYKGEMPVPYVPCNEDVAIDFGGPKLAVGIGYYKGDAWSKDKHWGNDKFAAIAKRMQMLGGRTFLLGDKKDQEIDGKVIQKIAVTSLCGRLGLKGTFGALKSCDIYIGNDTGLSHAAAAFGMPALSVFKPWASSFIKNRPYGPRCSYSCEWPGMDVTNAVWQWINYELQESAKAKGRS